MARSRTFGSIGVLFLPLFGLSVAVLGQFKEVGPAPFPETVARQRIKALLVDVSAANRQATVEKLFGLTAWYRDILDEELIAAWQKDTRANLKELMKPLADSRVSAAVVEFSWRQRREETFQLTYAPMLGDLMFRFPESAAPVLDDLLGPATPDLSPPVAEAVCRILVDMPDQGSW